MPTPVLPTTETKNRATIHRQGCRLAARALPQLSSSSLSILSADQALPALLPLPLEPGLSSPSSWPQPWSKPLSFFTQTVTKTFSWFRPPWVLQDAGGERRMLTPPPFPPTVLHSAPKADDGLSLITHQRRAIWRSVLLCDLLSVFPVRGS